MCLRPWNHHWAASFLKDHFLHGWTFFSGKSQTSFRPGSAGNKPASQDHKLCHTKTPISVRIHCLNNSEMTQFYSWLSMTYFVGVGRGYSNPLSSCDKQGHPWKGRHGSDDEEDKIKWFRGLMGPPWTEMDFQRLARYWIMIQLTESLPKDPPLLSNSPRFPPGWSRTVQPENRQPLELESRLVELGRKLCARNFSVWLRLLARFGLAAKIFLLSRFPRSVGFDGAKDPRLNWPPFRPPFSPSHW